MGGDAGSNLISILPTTSFLRSATMAAYLCEAGARLTQPFLLYRAKPAGT
jgi:hypothetical protein